MPKTAPITTARKNPIKGFVSHQPLFTQIVVEREYASAAIAGKERSNPPDIITSRLQRANIPSTTIARKIVTIIDA